MMNVQQPAQQTTEKKRLSIFRRSRDLVSRPQSPSVLESTDVKRSRFSFFRSNGRRSGVVVDTTLVAPTKGPRTPSSSSSSDDPSDGSRASGSGDEATTTDERNRALCILEGRSLPESESSPPSPVSAVAPAERASTPTSTGILPVPASFINALSIAARPSRSRSGSVASRRSVTETPDGQRASSRLGRVPEDRPVLALERQSTQLAEGSVVDENGLPTYASAAYPSRAVAYRFAQAGPFAMTLAGNTVEEEEIPGMGQYHIAVGVNVWSPRSFVTCVRRGLTDYGPLVAQIESGGTPSVGPTLTIGDVSKQLKEVFSKNLVNGSKVYYVGDGTSITWKLSRTQWKAYFENIPIARFSPIPPRTLVIEPMAHKFFDHLLIAVLLLMREKDDSVFARPEYGTVPPIPPFC